MSPREACVEWARILRAVAAGEMSPSKGLASRPVVEDEESVPRAYWTVCHKLEQQRELDAEGLLSPEQRAFFAEVLGKLADRIEGKAKVP